MSQTAGAGKERGVGCGLRHDPRLVVCCLQELAHTERDSPSPVHKAPKCQSQNTENKNRDEYNYEREIPFGGI